MQTPKQSRFLIELWNKPFCPLYFYWLARKKKKKNQYEVKAFFCSLVARDLLRRCDFFGATTTTTTATKRGSPECCHLCHKQCQSEINSVKISLKSKSIASTSSPKSIASSRNSLMSRTTLTLSPRRLRPATIRTKAVIRAYRCPNASCGATIASCARLLNAKVWTLSNNRT
jgi:hypothetical protein